MKRYFVTGLLIWVPLGITVWVIGLLVRTMDASLLLIPRPYRPDTLLGFHVPGLGVILTLLVIFITGVITANVIGQRLVRAWENLLGRIPVVNSIYRSVKQVSEALFSKKGDAFRKVVLVRFPHTRSWMLAFQTSLPGNSIQDYLDGEYVGVYVPTTPNPTSGYYLLLPRQDVIETDISVDAALKYIISMGVARSE